jgi:endonuclease YncB( thermonuclease family)
VILHDIHYGKYAGRVVARVQTPGGEDLSDALLRAGLGRGYQGSHRASWCQTPAS